MLEGWYEDTYFVLFDSQESTDLTARYGLERCLPGYVVVGLAGWDDFIVRDRAGAYFNVPTVPVAPKRLSPAPAPPTGHELQNDTGLRGKIKWFVQPLVFGGDPQNGPNVAWVDLLTHADLVRWWNQKYQEVGKGA
jgi:hypothetical protein